MTQCVFNRYEKKFLMPGDVYRKLRERLDEYMQMDDYGEHTICNIYYDTPDDLLIRRSIEHPVYKEKLRLRSYGVPQKDGRVFLEIKKKYRRMVNKRRIPLTLTEATAYVGEGKRPAADGQILKEMDFLLQRYTLRPALYLAYDRIALFGREDPAFRVTFDRSIRSRRTDVALDAGDAGEALLPEDWYLMESKILGAAPTWFAGLLSDMKIYATSFSKYGNIYKKERGLWDAETVMKNRLVNWRDQ